MMISEPKIPSVMKRMGKIMTADPIIVFARLITVLVELSSPVNSLEFLRVATF
jgi:hypothetical protein